MKGAVVATSVAALAGGLIGYGLAGARCDEDHRDVSRVSAPTTAYDASSAGPVTTALEARYLTPSGWCAGMGPDDAAHLHLPTCPRKATP